MFTGPRQVDLVTEVPKIEGFKNNKKQQQQQKTIFPKKGLFNGPKATKPLDVVVFFYCFGNMRLKQISSVS